MEKVATYIPAAQYKAVEHSVYNKVHNSHSMRIDKSPKIHVTSEKSEITPSGCLHMGKKGIKE